MRSHRLTTLSVVNIIYRKRSYKKNYDKYRIVIKSTRQRMESDSVVITHGCNITFFCSRYTTYVYISGYIVDISLNDNNVREISM